ncbi:MAG: D-aminoacyl-tRNA deacylase [Spirochaetota bacterium]
MIGLIQRVREAEVWVEDQCISNIGEGILLFAGISRDDDLQDAVYLARKIANLRIFSDEKGALNLSLLQRGGEVLVVSQFTLLADTRKGRRPSFTEAAPPSEAETLYKNLIDELRKLGIPVKEGKFQAIMDVKLINHGPVTIIINSKDHKT